MTAKMSFRGVSTAYCLIEMLMPLQVLLVVDLHGDHLPGLLAPPHCLQSLRRRDQEIIIIKISISKFC